MFSSLRYEDGVVHLLDQRQLPGTEVWVACHTVESVASAIEAMVVRGAPAIANAAVLSLAASAKRRATNWGQRQDDLDEFRSELKRLASTRPTAVNLFKALEVIEVTANRMPLAASRLEVARHLELEAMRICAEDLATCKAIGRHGLDWLKRRCTKNLRVLTHCNTGSLATAGYGTALGIVRALWAEGLLSMVYVDETRPYLQGSRLTAYELSQEGIPYTVVCDSAAAFLMQRGEVDAICVGADRIVANGDTANKIGTYSLAVQAHYHHIPFIVAAPSTTFDLGLSDGTGITIEERSPEELRQIGNLAIAPAGAPVFNPSFDVTPANLISAIVTDRGVIDPVVGEQLLKVLGAAVVCS